MASRKIERITTPVGIAKYPWLNAPDVRFKKEGVYQVRLIVPEEDAKALCDKLDAMVDKAYNAAVDEAKTPQKKKAIHRAPPYNCVFDEAGESTGEVEFKFKSNASGISTSSGKEYRFAPKAFDSKGKEIDMPAVYSGSKIRVNFSPSLYYMPTTRTVGVSLRLNAVQILELVTGSGGDAKSYGFGCEDNYNFVDGDKNGPAADPDDEDEAESDAEATDF